MLLSSDDGSGYPFRRLLEGGEPVGVGFSSWRYLGNGSFGTREPFDFITADARAGFHGENLTKLEITSHKSRQKVSGNNATLKVTLHRGLIDITRVKVVLGVQERNIEIAETQTEFDVTVDIHSGENNVVFTTLGLTLDDELVPVPNNWQADTEERTFVLIGEAKPVVVKYSCVNDLGSFVVCSGNYGVFDPIRL